MGSSDSDCNAATVWNKLFTFLNHYASVEKLLYQNGHRAEKFDIVWDQLELLIRLGVLGSLGQKARLIAELEWTLIFQLIKICCSS